MNVDLTEAEMLALCRGVTWCRVVHRERGWIPPPYAGDMDTAEAKLLATLGVDHVY
jgi:hypothetical protein